MMTKKENFLSLLNYAKIVGLVCATVLVAVFQFVSKPFLIKLSLGFYSVSFMILAASEFIKFAGLVKQKTPKSTEPKKIESSDKQEQVEEELARQKALKTNKVLSMLMGIVYSIMAIFTLVVFILY